MQALVSGIDLDLVRKYNLPGPRYTSYPPATNFSQDLAWGEVASEISGNKNSSRALSLYCHLPFCRSLCWYCGCNTVITRQQGQSATYLDYLKTEISRMAALLGQKREVVQLHWGGGTPTFLTRDEIFSLGTFLREQFRFSKAAEASVEIDPRGVTLEKIEALRQVGFNRASIGVQDFDPVVQKAVHRIQSFEENRRVMDQLREAGFSSLNIDLIYGLPFQTRESFERTLDQVLVLAPTRLAVFSYAHVPWIKSAQKILSNTLPLPETKLQILEMVVDRLGAAGYEFVGMDHFARADDELVRARREKTLYRNFQGYSTHRGADLHAFGMSGISQTQDIYWQNEKGLGEYYQALKKGDLPLARGYQLTGDDKLRREVIMRIMCDLAIEFKEISREFNIAFADYFHRELELLDTLEKDGLVEISSAGLAVTSQGRFFLRNIAMCFDAYLPAATERRFSRTI